LNRFYEVEPSIENYWRSIILFGKNVASYKFALAKALYDLRDKHNNLILLEELAEPYVKHILEHLKYNPKQITSKSSLFLESCNKYNSNEISYDELIQITIKKGFNNVIDAFHNVHSKEVEKRFFIDERKISKGIIITDNFYILKDDYNLDNLNLEVEARWRLVETGWQLGISKNMINIEYDKQTSIFFTNNNQVHKRIDITSSRDSLNGYQKGKCFYCYDSISIDSYSSDLADVDHFLPWILSNKIQNINGVWNLVLSCKQCNRGECGKFEKIPTLELLEKLHKRNEYLINSHLPLRETLIRQTGATEKQRRGFLQKSYNIAIENIIHTWKAPLIKGAVTF
jgi:hypothetical protein